MRFSAECNLKDPIAQKRRRTGQGGIPGSRDGPDRERQRMQASSSAMSPWSYDTPDSTAGQNTNALLTGVCICGDGIVTREKCWEGYEEGTFCANRQ